MPEMKHNFIKGRMNKDLDERLVSDGEYRDAMNIEVSTSESDAAGTVQTVMGNTLAYEYIDNNSNFDLLAPTGGNIAGSYVDNKTNNIYLLIHCNEYHDNQILTDSSIVKKDIIAEYNNGIVKPVVVDIWRLSMLDLANDFLFAPTSIPGSAGQSTWGLTSVEGLESGMVITGYDANSSPVYTAEIYYITTSGVNNVTVRFENVPISTVFFDIVRLEFERKRSLNFISNKFITGINVVDDLLFWTDNRSEPKKINIPNFKSGTPTFNRHSKFMVYDNDGILQSQKPMKEEHITVIKRSPLAPPILEMYNNIGGRGNIFGVTDLMNFTILSGDDVQQVANGTVISVPISGIMPDFFEGDILLFSNVLANVEEGVPFENAIVRGVIISISSNQIDIRLLSTRRGFFEYAEDATIPTVGETWAVCLEQAKALFEFKFPRFAYRYKYQDGEYSCFSPFSEVGFLPTNYKWASKDGYNLGMVNQLRFLKILDFIPDGIPKGVVSVDVLYKESNSSNIYTVKTIKKSDDEWNAVGSGGPSATTKGALQLESEMIYATVPSNQLLRPWDNVPRKALAQEVSGNRIIYANYLQNYDIPGSGSNKINISTYIRSQSTADINDDEVITSSGKPGKSIKSLRTYQVGIVYKDEFGRETPVLTNEKASFNIGKQQADNYNSLSVQVHNSAPDWAETFKFFIKETSNEYYNLAMDRWYDAEDGNIWLSFASAERNKVDEQTFLILKKEHDSNDFVSQEARYKILAIDNNVPDYVKTERISWGTGITDGVNPSTWAVAGNQVGVEDWDQTQFENQIEGKQGLSIRFNFGSKYTPWYEIKHIKTEGTSTSVDAIITIKKTFGEEILDIGLTATNSSAAANFEIRQEKVRMKPEFDGRFFVKINKDAEGVIDQAILTKREANDEGSFSILMEMKQFYMRSTGRTPWGFKRAWWGEPESMATRLGEMDGSSSDNCFYIDSIRRSPWQGKWENDNGYGIEGVHVSQRALDCHMELSLSGINDGGEASFSIDEHPKKHQDFYKKMTTVGTWFRWKEDPNGVIYQIDAVKHKGSNKYDIAHGTGIYNYETKQSRKAWRSNKTRRMYINLSTTGFLFDSSFNGGSTYTKEPIQGFIGLPPAWAYDTVPNHPIPGGFKPTHSGVAQIMARGSNGTVLGDYNLYAEIDGSTAASNCQSAQTSAALATASNALSTAQALTDGSGGLYGTANPGTGVIARGNVNLRQTERSLSSSQFSGTQYDTSEQDIPWTTAGGDAFHTNKYNTIQIMERFNPDSEKFSSEEPAIFETEPKEDVGLDIYHEIDQAFPVKLSGLTNELFIPYNSIISSDNPDVVLRKHYDLGTPGCTPCWDKGDFTINTPHVDLTSAPNIFGTTWLKPGMIIRAPGIIPMMTSHGIDTKILSVDGALLTMDQDALQTTTNQTINYTEVEPAKVIYWSDNMIHLNCEPTNASHARLPTNIQSIQHAFTFTRPDGSTVTAGLQPSILNPHNVGIGGPITNTWMMLDVNTANSKVDLSWYNCYSFGNGVESNRIRDDYNAVTIDKGAKVSTTLAEKYEEERRCTGLIYSGIYNSTSGINRLNQFIQAEAITKDLNPRFGCIQKLHARDTDLVTLCEDKVLRLLANKDAVYNADGNATLTATNRVLGTPVPYPGDYGISKNPESFANQAFRSYFTDKQRGAVIRLSRDGLVPISDHGMKDWFADQLGGASGKIIGSYDVKKDSYNITLGYNTVSFAEKSNGWTSFKSFIQEGGVSLNNAYFTFKNGEMYRHHEPNVSIGTFYNIKTEPHIEFLLNQSPGVQKSFGSLNYEGSQARITQNITDGEYHNNVGKSGWYLASGETNLQSTSELEFKNKEGKWFSRMKGERTGLDNIDTREFSFQGIDMASNVVVDTPSWNCYDFNCVDPQDGTGIYTTLAACQTACVATVAESWDCLHGSCSDPGTGNGYYSTLSACQTACSVVVVSYDCINGICVDPGTGLGQYASLTLCENDPLCTSGPPIDSWDCVEDTGGSWSCVDPGTGLGQYSSLLACQSAPNCSNLPPLWQCDSIGYPGAFASCSQVLPSDPNYVNVSNCIGSCAWLSEATCLSFCQVWGCMDDGITTDPIITAQRPPGWVGPANNYYAGASAHDPNMCIYMQQLVIQDDLSDH